MNLTPHFTFDELTITNHRSLLAQNREAAQGHLQHLTATAEMMEEVRALWGVPIIVHSGFRCWALNNAIGGSKTSQHMEGEALDFHPLGMDLEAAWRDIAHSRINFGQLILEGWAQGRPSWIHLSLGPPWRPARISRQVMTWDPLHGYHLVQP